MTVELNNQRVLTPKARFQATIWTQIGGFLIFVVLLIVFGLDNSDITKGLVYIQRCILLYVIGTLSIYLVPFLLAWYREGETYDELNVDIGVWLFVTLDICVLMFLVVQETGLCRSMFLPVFLLIPIAYIPVENPEKRHRILIVLGMIVSGMIICYYLSDRPSFSLLDLLPTFVLYGAVSVLLFAVIERPSTLPTRPVVLAILLLIVATICPFFLQNIEGPKSFRVTTTDFHHNAHNRFDVALFIVSLLSILIPIMQTLIIIFQRRRITRQADAVGGVSLTPALDPE